MMWFSCSRLPYIPCDCKVTKTRGILVPWVFKAYVGSVRGLWMRMKLKEGLVVNCEQSLRGEKGGQQFSCDAIYT